LIEPQTPQARSNQEKERKARDTPKVLERRLEVKQKGKCRREERERW
jgi:hypothetical protein